MSNEARKQCGQRCQAAREALGLTQEAFGKLVRNYTPNTVSRWETGRQVPSYEDRLRIAEVLRCDPWSIELIEKAS